MFDSKSERRFRRENNRDVTQCTPGSLIQLQKFEIVLDTYRLHEQFHLCVEAFNYLGPLGLEFIGNPKPTGEIESLRQLVDDNEAWRKLSRELLLKLPRDHDRIPPEIQNELRGLPFSADPPVTRISMGALRRASILSGKRKLKYVSVSI